MIKYLKIMNEFVRNREKQLEKKIKVFLKINEDLLKRW